MKIATLVLSAIVLIALSGFLWLQRRTRLLKRKSVDQISSAVDQALAGLTGVEEQDKAAIAKLAEDPLLRRMLFRRLSKTGRQALFPPERRTVRALGESDLAAWLLHPNELGAAPSGMHAVQTLTVDDAGTPARYVVCRFCTNPPHWASGKGWMAGIAGPYPVSDDDLPAPSHVFSELEPYAKRPPAGHLEFLLKQRGNPLIVKTSTDGD